MDEMGILIKQYNKGAEEAPNPQSLDPRIFSSLDYFFYLFIF